MIETPAREERLQKVVDRVRDQLLSGQQFALAAISHRSRRGYEPPVNRRDYAASLKVLARMTAESDALAQVASAIVGRVNLYGTNSDAAAKIWEAAGEALGKGFDDVIGRAAPDAGRWSDHQRDFSLDERLRIWAYLQQATRPFDPSASARGWAFVRLAEIEGIRLPEEVAR